MIFENRKQAGEILGQRLCEMDLGKDIYVVALPRGGVPIGWEIANKLRAPLDVLLVKKIPHPNQPELAVGAISEVGEVYWDEGLLEWLGLSKKSLLETAKKIHRSIQSQIQEWRAGKPPVNVKNKTVIIVDDGLATGATMRSAIQLLKKQRPLRIVVAVPVGAAQTARELKAVVDDVTVLQQPEPFYSVGQWYDDFTQVTDDQVREILKHTIVEDYEAVSIPQDDSAVAGHLHVPNNPKALIIFAHGSGSNHKSPRQQRVSKKLYELGFATLLFDLLTPEEAENRKNVFDIALLAERLRGAKNWAKSIEELKQLPIGYFGASTGAAAALTAAAGDPDVRAIVSRGGRPDLTVPDFKWVTAPVLLMVGGEDHGVIELNEEAHSKLPNSKIEIVPGAGHLFEERGTLEQVIELSASWFEQTLLERKEKIIVNPKQRFVAEADRLARSLEDDKGYSELAEQLSKHNIVMFGEATHGTEEFYEIRRKLSQILIDGYGYKFIAVEGDWPDCYKLNRYIQTGGGKSANSKMSDSTVSMFIRSMSPWKS